MTGLPMTALYILLRCAMRIGVDRRPVRTVCSACARGAWLSGRTQHRLYAIGDTGCALDDGLTSCVMDSEVWTRVARNSLDTGVCLGGVVVDE